MPRTAHVLYNYHNLYINNLCLSCHRWQHACIVCQMQLVMPDPWESQRHNNATMLDTHAVQPSTYTLPCQHTATATAERAGCVTAGVQRRLSNKGHKGLPQGMLWQQHLLARRGGGQTRIHTTTADRAGGATADAGHSPRQHKQHNNDFSCRQQRLPANSADRVLEWSSHASMIRKAQQGGGNASPCLGVGSVHS